MAFDYTTPGDCFAYGNSAGTATDPVNEMAVMAQVVTAISRAIDGYCEQTFCLDTIIDARLRAVIDADGVLTCYPPVPTISAVTAASYRLGADATWQTLAAADLDIEEAPYGCTVRALGLDLRGSRNQRAAVRLSYTGGYADLAALPKDLAWYATQLSWFTYQRRSAPMERTAVPELGVLIIPGQWPADIRNGLNRYKKVTPS